MLIQNIEFLNTFMSSVSNYISAWGGLNHDHWEPVCTLVQLPWCLFPSITFFLFNIFVYFFCLIPCLPLSFFVYLSICLILSFSVCLSVFVWFSPSLSDSCLFFSLSICLCFSVSLFLLSSSITSRFPPLYSSFSLFPSYSSSLFFHVACVWQLTARMMEGALTCPVCSHVYECGERDPLVLPCGHTFCRGCLVSLEVDACFACPSCRASHRSESLDAFPVNFSLLNLSQQSHGRVFMVGSLLACVLCWVDIIFINGFVLRDNIDVVCMDGIMVGSSLACVVRWVKFVCFFYWRRTSRTKRWETLLM